MDTMAAPVAAGSNEVLAWLETALPRAFRVLKGTEDLDAPLLQLPIAQMRLVQALYSGCPEPGEDHGETMTRLSERLQVRNNALTQAADRLVNHGLAERLSDPDDRRVVRLRLTRKGFDLVCERKARHRARLAEVWHVLSLDEREHVVQAVHALASAGEKLAQGAGK